MITKNMQINIPSGFTPNIIAKFIQIASQYESKIYVEVEDKHVNAKSLMGMMSLGLPAGEKIDVIVDGRDEDEAMESIEAYLNA